MGRPRKYKPRPCRFCGETIGGSLRSDATFCGPECKDAWHNRHSGHRPRSHKASNTRVRTARQPAPARERILQAFKSAAKHRLTTYELAAISPNHRDHIAALRSEGCLIETRPLNRQTYQYVLRKGRS